nr:structural protein 1 - hepatitis E virus (strain Indian) [Hepatitis E virus]
MNNMSFAAPMGSRPCALGLFCCCSSCFLPHVVDLPQLGPRR